MLHAARFKQVLDCLAASALAFRAPQHTTGAQRMIISSRPEDRDSQSHSVRTVSLQQYEIRDTARVLLCLCETADARSGTR